jgi:transcription factor AP-4
MVTCRRLPSPSNSLDDGTPQARLYLANTSRQNLETIVEAIRHLEGDHLFSDEPAQDVPLALTNKPSNTATSSSKQRLLHAEVNNFLQFHTTQQQQQQQQQQQPSPTASQSVTQQTQQRPGVIVVKHS